MYLCWSINISKGFLLYVLSCNLVLYYVCFILSPYENFPAPCRYKMLLAFSFWIMYPPYHYYVHHIWLNVPNWFHYFLTFICTTGMTNQGWVLIEMHMGNWLLSYFEYIGFQGLFKNATFFLLLFWTLPCPISCIYSPLISLEPTSFHPFPYFRSTSFHSFWLSFSLIRIRPSPAL